MKKILSQLFDFLRTHIFTVIFLLLTLFFSLSHAFIWAGLIILFFIFELILYYTRKLFDDKKIGLSIKVSKNTGEVRFKFRSISVKWYEDKNSKLFDLQSEIFNEIKEELGEEFNVDEIKFFKD